MKLLQKEIRTKEDIKNYIDFLITNDLLYHFDEDACNILSRKNDYSESLFTEEQCKLIDQRRNEMFKIDYDYSFEYACELLED